MTEIGLELDGPQDVGFGLAYARCTQFVGLGGYTNAGKLMGLSAYGDPTRYAALGPLWSTDDNDELTSAMRICDKRASVPLLFARRGLSPPQPGNASGFERQDLRDFAAWVQRELERVAIARVARLAKTLDAPAVCIAGGVGLNSVLNARLQDALGLPVYVPPQPDDTGQAVGNVLLAYLDATRSDGAARRWPGHPALGGGCDPEGLRAFRRSVEASGCEVYAAPDVAATAATSIACGAIVGWFQGRSEHGSRALGWRSVLADPRNSAMRDRLNAAKGREWFRPLAPAVLREAAADWFELPASPLWATMSGTTRARNRATSDGPAAVHVDGTSRVQVVDAATNPVFHSLIAAFSHDTGVPMVLNTSFNSAGEPIVETPQDAFAAARTMGLDALYVSDLCVRLPK